MMGELAIGDGILKQLFHDAFQIPSYKCVSSTPCSKDTFFGGYFLHF